MLEIERKYTINGFPEHLPLVKRARMWQGYISTKPVVRIRKIKWENGRLEFILTFKSKGGLARRELEIPITADHFKELCYLLEGELIRKDYRVYRLPDGHLLECNEVDSGEPTSYMYAEIEFDDLREAGGYKKPDCCAAEITGKDLSMAHYWRNTRILRLQDRR